ncbi:LysE family translocator [Proteus mirabilis]|uniref:LysE family translocator n=1 Tax=Proteus mirabilis TaxID=584 RepID=UPI0013D009DA|nr:LysE family translocator [Proteus mirabilis]ELA7711697.1 LysE family translocator [Proteus mirabilis]ELB1215931.1 LysE family translocator [Proteus mirabilis]ELB1713117.1 LysE family translocator [Proteus mirabilis]MBG2964242.1 LysE family translocator [Proteus mirabilis]MBG3039950.1 LysE family translocator [Proteus mirabilis]
MPILLNMGTFALLSLGLVLTPGPNMIYLISRSISQGRNAGFISLIGVAVGYIFYMLLAAFGITAIFMTVPYTYDTLKICGAIYLLYIAWQSIKLSGHSIFHPKKLLSGNTTKLFVMGFITNLLNSKIVLMYLSLLPQFISVQNGNVLNQSLILGSIQIIISIAVNALVVVTARAIAGFFIQRPCWELIQRWFMATILGALAIKLATETRVN